MPFMSKKARLWTRGEKRLAMGLYHILQVKEAFDLVNVNSSHDISLFCLKGNFATPMLCICISSSWSPCCTRYTPNAVKLKTLCMIIFLVHCRTSKESLAYIFVRAILIVHRKESAIEKSKQTVR